MRVLLLAHAFNSLTQRLWVALTARGHEVSLELDIADAVSLEAVQLFRPDVVVASFLKRALPEALWACVPCLVVHPGPPGDRGPSSLDWAILDGKQEWGVTVLQANAVMDGGPVWAFRSFPMRAARKSSLYRNEVTEAATGAVLEALEKLAAGARPEAQREATARPRPLMKQEHRRIDWTKDDTETVLRKVRASDSVPGVLDSLGGQEVYLYNAFLDATRRGAPGTLLGRKSGAVLRATVDGAVWLTHLKRAARTGESEAEAPFKLPAVEVLGEAGRALPELAEGWAPIGYQRAGDVGLLSFDFYNGAMSTSDCLALRDAFLEAARRPTKVLVLLGGPDFWSNGIHLNTIEVASSPADESLRNIEAMDELCRAIIECTSQLTVAALQGNAGAGGCFLALAADVVLARDGVVQNPHYKNMGNLYGSEYWTYLLPRRVGAKQAEAITQNRMPLGAQEAKRAGLVDECFPGSPGEFVSRVKARAQGLASAADFERRLSDKRARRATDEATRPLSKYREEELAKMRLNFYGFDPSYHVARFHFVHRLPHAWTPLHLARHRAQAWKKQAALTTRVT
ncbi:MAG: hydrogenase maturation protein [Myxococcales bacterium]|nr:hydrogenase maturation protein [Myxococcales bacterium]